MAISPNKNKVSIMKAAYSGDALTNFLSDLMSGRGSLDDIKGKVAVKKADKWDGKDA